MERHRFCTSLMVTASLLLAGVLAAQGLDLSWYTIDAGGQMLTTGGEPTELLTLSGSIGQPDSAVLTGSGYQGLYTLQGGFWGGVRLGIVVLGDCNGDGDVDLDDYAGFPECLLGPEAGIPDPECLCLDVDDSGHVDLVDFAGFQVAFDPP